MTSPPFIHEKEEDSMEELGVTSLYREAPWAASQSQELPESSLHGYRNRHICSRYVSNARLCLFIASDYIYLESLCISMAFSFLQLHRQQKSNTSPECAIRHDYFDETLDYIL